MASKKLYLVLMASIIFVGCKKESESSTHEEVYGQEYTYEKTTDFDVPQKNRNSIPESYFTEMDVTISINDEEKKKCTVTNESVYRLEEEPDGTILLIVMLYGILEESEDGWTTYCLVNVSMPWSTDLNPSLPYYWEFDNKYLTQKSENFANFHSRVYSGVSMYKDKGDYMEDPDTYEYQAMYPWPPGEDPHYVEFDGYVTVLEKSVISFDEPLAVLLESETVGKDHAGNIIETIISGH